jgi:hypothetical protein
MTSPGPDRPQEPSDDEPRPHGHRRVPVGPLGSVRCLRATVLATNAPAIGLLRRLWATVHARDGREVVSDVDLPEPPGAPPRLLALLRAVAAGTLAPRGAIVRRDDDD